MQSISGGGRGPRDFSAHFLPGMSETSLLVARCGVANVIFRTTDSFLHVDSQVISGGKKGNGNKETGGEI